MGIDSRQAAYQQLIELAEKQGYVTFDNIMDCADEHSLPIQDFDWLTNSITTRGILVYNEVPDRAFLSDDEDGDDCTQSDYDLVFNRIVQLSPSLEQLVSYVKTVLPPQRGEVRQLKYQIVDGNSFARTRMIEMHLRLALKIALQRAEEFNANIEDTVGNAFVGLVTAIDKYDPDSNGAFTPYASLWILQVVSREQDNKRPLIYYPHNKKEGYSDAYQSLRSQGCLFCDELLQCPKAKQIIIDELQCSEDNALVYIEQMCPLDSIDILRKNHLDNDLDFISIDEEFILENDMDIYLQNKMLRENLDIVLHSLTPREEQVIRMRFGLNDDHEYTLEEVGSAFCLTRERVRQIEAKALRKLRHPSRARFLKGFLPL